MEGTTSLDMFIPGNNSPDGIFYVAKASFKKFEEVRVALIYMLALVFAARVEDEQVNTEKTEENYYIIAYWHRTSICVRDVGRFGLTIHARYIFVGHSSTLKKGGGYSAAMFIMVSILEEAKVYFGHIGLTIFARYFFLERSASIDKVYLIYFGHIGLTIFARHFFASAPPPLAKFCLVNLG